MAPPADAVLAFASGFPLVLLGGLLLAIRPWRAQQVFFATFAILWGLQVITANYGRVFRDADVHATMLLVSHVFMMVATLFLTHFAARLRPHRGDWIPAAAMGAVVGTAALVYVLDPSLFVHGVVEQDSGQYATTYGPLLAPLVQVPFFAAFVLAITLLYFEYRRARPGSARHRPRGILIALMLFASYTFVRFAAAQLRVGSSFAQFASGSVRSASAESDLLLAVSFSAGAAILFALALHAFLRPPPPEDRDLPLLMAFLFPAGVALMEEVLGGLGFLRLETLGFWRFLSVGVLAFTVANYQLFDLDVRLKQYAGPGTAGVLGLFGVPLALALAEGSFGWQATALTLLPEVIGIAAVLAFRHRVEERLFPGVRGTVEYTHQRRLELYKVALEDALLRGRDPDHPSLRDVRVRYGISDEEHKILLWVSGEVKKDARKEPATLDTAPGAVLLDRYRIERLLGEGTRRATYLATDTKSRQLVALKVVDTEALDGAAARLLLREARLVATLDHAHILTVFDVAEVSGHVVIVTDYADEGNLGDYLQHNGPMPLRDAVRFLSELLAGLQALHERDIIHRNLKPKNVLLDADGTVLIADLSAAYAADNPSEDELAAHALLDFLYLSPEQLVKVTDATARSDLYVAAVLFHLVLTGHYPFAIAGRSDAAIRHAILETPPQLDLNGNPAWVRTFLQQAMAKDPAARFADAASMRETLHREAGIRATAA